MKLKKMTQKIKEITLNQQIFKFFIVRKTCCSLHREEYGGGKKI